MFFRKQKEGEDRWNRLGKFFIYSMISLKKYLQERKKERIIDNVSK